MTKEKPTRFAMSSFQIGDKVRFGEKEVFTVVRYHKVNGKFEVMLRNTRTKVHRSIPCSQLEAFVG